MGFVNVATGDRVFRVVLGVAMLAAGWGGWVPGVWGVALEIFGWVPLVTGLLGWCPFYALLGIRTTKDGRGGPWPRGW
jgi:hypothetical protein